jgi:hypothetical protein
VNINYHDSVAPYLAEKISGEESKLVTDESNIMITGSILSDAHPNTTVWGAGLGSFKEVVPECDIRAVRGPLTGMKCKASGLECDTFGDPALLLPRFYNPEIEKKYEVGIIPHFVDWYQAHQSFRGKRIINILDDTETVINNILECKKIVSSCLHGLITAEAYGIPTAHITFGDTLAGDGMKFYDYYMSIGYEPREPTKHDGRITPFAKRLNIDLDKLMSKCPL